MNTIEKINTSGEGAKIRGKYGIKKGNEIIKKIAEVKDNCKYPLYGKDD